MADEVLKCARFGDVEELKAMLQSVEGLERDMLINFVQPETLNTPLHMACANGHVECVRELLQYEALQHLPNANGNLPLHWAVQNKHREIVKLLVDGIKDLDVLARNSFGRGCVTEAFQCEDTEILAMLLEHSSATEERLAEGTGIDQDAIKEEIEKEGDEADNSSPKVLQETVLEFKFAPGLPTLRARELAFEWSRDAFGSTAEEDITGVSIWSAALILSRWVIDHRDVFDGKQVCELGSGCGVSGFAVHKYTDASRVVLSDLFAHTIQNLEHNVELNKTDTNARADDKENPIALVLDCCGRCGAVQRFTPDNPEGKLMTCGGCRSVAYCSRECQKKAWKKHKPDCKAIRAQREQVETLKERKASEEGVLQVQAIDWAQRETWPISCDDDKFDVLFGSDLVYHQEIVPALVNVVDGMLGAGGRFVHVASQARHSLVEFKEAMEARGFSCDVEEVPEDYKENPLVGNDAVAELFALHFNEMSDVYCIYTFTRPAVE
ncbi:hypothetical protein KXD40_002452 [Peronospora effusa]|uniref:MYND-type domain-containing protein n=1 Tax=Peronospora effusa TaxID=542832 RepID=A0A3M6VWA2_9STRA|nr:hypothetical protein DD238_002452 [Peronospora effusa]UIZ26043.1 hypothetical protein KXD40_002452 [Peronospora effusa]CAI5704001.1 unnamed protein product [Peronospora effusa]